MNTNPNSKPRRPNRLCGVFVVAYRRRHDGPKVWEGQYFPTSLAASQYLGYRSDIVARHLYLSLKEGISVVGGIWFKTAKQLYKDSWSSSWSPHYKWLLRQFPFIRDGRVVFNDRPRWTKKRARLLDIPCQPKQVSPEPEYQI